MHPHSRDEMPRAHLLKQSEAGVSGAAAAAAAAVTD